MDEMGACKTYWRYGDGSWVVDSHIRLALLLAPLSNRKDGDGFGIGSEIIH